MKKPSEDSKSESYTENTLPLSHLLTDDTGNAPVSEAKTNWYFGEWPALAHMSISDQWNPKTTAECSALKAMGYYHLDSPAAAKPFLLKARDMGCPKEVLNRLLVNGIHNSLGKIAALRNQPERSQVHFQQAVTLNSVHQDLHLVQHARSVREMTRLGLLPQAAHLIQEESDTLQQRKINQKQINTTQHILRSEIELLQHELGLASQKAQLYSSSSNAKGALYNTDGSINKERLKQLSPSQLGQDLWVLEQTNYKQGGFFVEFGATDGILLSNTYLLEKEFGWQGICTEPNPKFFKDLQKNRSCITDNACISATSDEKINFILANEYGGIDGISTEGLHKNKVQAYKDNHESIELNTTSLHDFLIEHHAPKEIDYLSIDTEGSEFKILENFPFDQWVIHIITVEHNFEPQRENIRKLLIDLNYQCIESQWDDWYILLSIKDIDSKKR